MLFLKKVSARTHTHTHTQNECAPHFTAMPDLIRLVHKNSMGLGRLIKTFREHWGTKVTASSLASEDPMGIQERSTSPSDDVTKTTTATEVSPFCKPKTPGTGGSELENASGISKRQLEKKIQSIATKEARPPNNRHLWYVHDTILQKYGIDGSTQGPMASPGNENKNTKVPSPQTPSGSGVTRKRKPKGMKSLFDFVNSASAASSVGSGGGEQLSVKRAKLDEGGTAKSSKPQATADTKPPPSKKARLDSDASPTSKSSDTTDVIVIHSDDSSSGNGTLGQVKGVEHGNSLIDITNSSTPALNGFTAPALSLLTKLLQECTNASLH